MSNTSINSFKSKSKVILLYDSKFGNTKNVAISLSRGLEAGGIDVDCSSIKDFEIEDFNLYNVIGIGGPTHFRGLSKPMKKFFTKIKKLNLKEKFGFAFETKGDFRLAGSSGKQILKRLKNKSMRIVYHLISGIVIDQEGPLLDNTLNRMEKTGLKIADILYQIYIKREVNKNE